MQPRRVLMFDSEVYRDYYLAMFKNVETGGVRAFELFDGQPFDEVTVRKVLAQYRIVTFNGNHFDLPLLWIALRGGDTQTIKQAGDRIIKNNLHSWDIERMYDARPLRGIDHVDLIEVAPGKASLKVYGGRLHCPTMQDLPIEPDASISPTDREDLKTYCGNDLSTTMDLYTTLKPQIELRERMGAGYGGIDLRSKSDAQIAEAVICQQVKHITGADVKRPAFDGAEFFYQPPPFIRFTTPDLQATLAMVRNAEFVVPDTGKVMMPKELGSAKIAIGNGVYRMGIGGLHSSEQTAAHVADDNTVIVDRDVASYYPAIILRTGMAPPHMGVAFSTAYQAIVARRLAAKRAGDKVTADALKITVNGSFGKFGSKWSKLFAPHLLIQTTLTGQLALLMLIETLELEGIPVLSANTDGVVIKCPVDKLTMMEVVVWEWEQLTGFETEAANYRALYSRDVNNYIAIKSDGGVKLKGAYAPPGLQKNPTNEICSEAVVKFLSDGTPVEQTIRACLDIRKFLSIRQVKGGAVKDGALLGKAVRWYYAKGVSGVIEYKVNGYTVPRSEGARPCMTLPTVFPDDIDFDWYITEAHSILNDVGYRSAA